MSDANRFHSEVMEKTTVNRPVLTRALRMETVSTIIDTFTIMYTEAVQVVSRDGKKLDRVQKILTSRLVKNCTMLANRLDTSHL